MAGEISSLAEDRVYTRVTWRLLPFLGVCYLIAYLDRVNVGFAKLQMLADLSMSEAAYGFGAGIFFIGYFFFEIPSNLALHRIGARLWIARIMLTWGVISGAMAFIEPMARATGLSVNTVFYGMRFLLGAAEAGFFPGVLLYLNLWFPSHRQSRAVALLLMAQPFSFVFGGPVSGAIMDGFASQGGLLGWQWLFLIEAAPAVLLGLLVLGRLDNGIDEARWLTPDEKLLLQSGIAKDASHKTDHSLRILFTVPAIWLFIAILFCLVTGVYGINFWFPTIIAATGLKSVFAVGMVTAACYFSSAVMTVLISRHAERVNEKRWHATIAAVVGGTCLALSAVSTESTLLTSILLSLATTGGLVASALFWSFPGSLLKGAGVAAGLAAINSFGNLGGFAGPYLLGLLTQLLDSRTAGVAALGAFMVCAGLIIAATCSRYGLRRAS